MMMMMFQRLQHIIVFYSFWIKNFYDARSTSSYFCGGYGLGMSVIAVTASGRSEDLLTWLMISACLFLAGLAHDNEMCNRYANNGKLLLQEKA